MLTRSQVRAIAGSYIGIPVTCVYRDKVRRGKIVKVMQGPCIPIPGKKEFNFLETLDGDVYVLWQEDGVVGVKTFRWEFMLALTKLPAREDITEPQSSAVITVRRMRPTIGGGT